MRKILVIFCIFILSACTQEKEAESFKDAEIVIEPPRVMEEYRVFVRNENARLGLYEPKEGVYAGVYTKDEIPDFDKKTAPHAMYVRNVTTKDVFPVSFILSCIANSKVPYIVVNPANAYDPFNLDDLAEIADEIGEFYAPVFVDIFPNADISRYNPADYISFFRSARAIFASRASNAALVFSCDELAEARLFYPGDDAVDWVGVNTADFEQIYFYFQKKKPVIVSEYAVSHQSDSDYSYQTKNAAAAVSAFYDNLKFYPRIKAINYINVNTLSGENYHNLSKNNYLVTDEALILEAYKKAVSERKFAKTVSYTNAEISSAYALSPFPAQYFDGEFFIDTRTVVNDLEIKMFQSEEYTPLTALGLKYRINPIDKIIYFD
ncbi:hypothetical protein AGMMS49975_13010 [Clostridia bacterium]|nr:hypothetical protein AGMMS49975_13010 [Clostridia bacterium]